MCRTVLNVADKYDDTPLLLAARRHDYKLVGILLAAEARAISECVVMILACIQITSF